MLIDLKAKSLALANMHVIIQIRCEKPDMVHSENSLFKINHFCSAHQGRTWLVKVGDGKVLE